MFPQKIRQNVFPLIAALIWGTAFVAQSVSAEYIGAFTFNALRGAIAFLTLILVSRAFTAADKRRGTAPPVKTKTKDLIIGGLCCGTLLTVASNLQQMGLSYTTAGKAGFITALYVVLVPVFGIFLKKRAKLQVWAGVMLAVAGLYLLCIKEDFTVGSGDALVMLCAVVFALHILCIDHFVRKVEGVRLSCVQFLVVAIWSGILMFIFEDPRLDLIMKCIGPILYVGIFSSAIAYTLQILAQRGSDPTVVCILLSLESVFSVVAGVLILGDSMSAREYVGCVIMFAAVILAQLPSRAERAAAQKLKQAAAQDK